MQGNACCKVAFWSPLAASCSFAACFTTLVGVLSGIMNGSRPTSRNERRRKDFKKGVDAEDARRKREDNIVQLRKDKRDENLQKKRAVFPSSGVGGAIEDSTRGGGSAAQKVCAFLYVVILGASTDPAQICAARASSVHGTRSLE